MINGRYCFTELGLTVAALPKAEFARGCGGCQALGMQTLNQVIREEPALSALHGRIVDVARQPPM